MLRFFRCFASFFVLYLVAYNWTLFNQKVWKAKFLISYCPEMEFKEFEPRFKSAKTRFKLSAGINLETFDIILSGTNHI